MPTTLHKNLTGADAVHPAAYVQSTDPGAVGAAKLWVDTSSGAGTAASPYPLKKRNTGNTAWEVVGGVGSLSALSDVTITSAAQGESLVYDATAAKWKNQRPAGVSIALARTCI